MEDLPESLLSEIFKRIFKTSDRNSLSLVSKHINAVEGDHRDFLRVGCGLHPATEGVTLLCFRFRNLKKMEIDYSYWTSNLGKQIGNNGLLVLSSHCPSLTELTLSFCSFIDDVGLCYLASCPNLRAFKLNFAPAVSSNGILSLVIGCRSLTALHLIRCMKVGSVGWLEYLGKFGALEDLSIKNCVGIGEDDLFKLGAGWKKLKSLEFEVDAHYKYPKVFDHLTVSRWHWEMISCEKLKELSLMNCIIARGRGLSCVLGKCEALEKLCLSMCFGIEDSDIAALAQIASNLRCISLCSGSQLRLTDYSLSALAQGCSKLLESVELCCSDGESPYFSSFTQSGLLALIRTCPIRILIINGACFFGDKVMEALCSAQFLQRLELVRCQEVTDEGIQLLVNLLSLTTLKLSRCLGVTDKGLKQLVGAKKLGTLVVEDCPQVSEGGIQGAARSVSYRQEY